MPRRILPSIAWALVTLVLAAGFVGSRPLQAREAWADWEMTGLTGRTIGLMTPPGGALLAVEDGSDVVGQSTFGALWQSDDGGDTWTRLLSKAFLVIRFTLHNITEGFGILTPLAHHGTTLRHLTLLGLLAGAPTIVGTWLGALRTPRSGQPCSWRSGPARRSRSCTSLLGFQPTTVEAGSSRRSERPE